MADSIIKSISYDQSEILSWIMQLCGIEKFCADISYGNGSFYKNIQKPDLKFDISPQVSGVISADSGSLPIANESLKASYSILLF